MKKIVIAVGNPPIARGHSWGKGRPTSTQGKNGYQRKKSWKNQD